MSRGTSSLAVCVVLAAATAAGCGGRERKAQPSLGGLEVRSLRFEGVRSVSEWRLRELLNTTQQSRESSSTGRYFQRDEFRKGLARIVAFYKHLGYPDARIVSIEVNRDMRTGTVDLRVVIDEGRPLTEGEGVPVAVDA